MLKSRLLAASLFFALSSQAFASTIYEVQFTNGIIEIEANVSGIQTDSVETQFTIEIKDILYGQKVVLKSEHGWGDGPLTILCQQIGLLEHGTTDLKYPSVYGDQYKVLGFFDSVFKPKYFVIQRDGSYKVEDSQPNSDVYTGEVSCSNRKVNY